MNEEQVLIEKQPLLFKQLQKSFKHGRISHAYLFEGDSGTGKHRLALWVAKRIFCTNLINGNPCNQCNNCVRINKNEHPDVFQIAPDGQTIKVEQIRQLKSEFSKSGMETTKKIFIIQQAEKMSVSAANSLLKFLEEPDGKIIAILETGSLPKILPTIQSRCQILHFQPLNKEKLTNALISHGFTKQLAELSTELTNSFDKAVEIAEEEWFNEAREIIQQWFNYLIQADRQAFVYVQKKMVKCFKDKEQQVLSFELLLAYYRRQLVQDVQTNKAKTIIEKQAKAVELILKAHQKWEANVSWQSVCEQLVIRMIALK